MTRCTTVLSRVPFEHSGTAIGRRRCVGFYGMHAFPFLLQEVHGVEVECLAFYCSLLFIYGLKFFA